MRIDFTHTFRTGARRAHPGRWTGRVARALLVWTTLLCSLAGAPIDARERPLEEGPLVEWVVPESALVPHQPFELGLRVEVDAAFLDERMVQLFRQELDLPVQLTAPFLEDPAELRALPLAETLQTRSLVLNDAVVTAVELPVEARADRTIRVFEVRRRYVATAPVRLPLPAPGIAYATTTGFRDDVFEGRVPVDRSDVASSGRSAALVVAPFPEDGRPAGFVDAVGTFELEARVDAAELALGSDLELGLTIRGDGNLETLTPPSLDGLAGWHLRGSGVLREADRVEVLATFTPRNARVVALPAIEFDTFDPVSSAYRVLSTRAIPIRIVVPETEGEVAPDDPDQRESPRLFVWVGIVLSVLAFVLLWVLRPRIVAAQTRPTSPREAARARLEAAPEATAEDVLFTEVVATLLERPHDDVSSHGLADRLASRGVPTDTAERTEVAFARLEAERYGGGSAAVDPGSLLALARELVSHPGT